MSSLFTWKCHVPFELTVCEYEQAVLLFPRPRHNAHTLLDVSRDAISKDLNGVTDRFKEQNDEQTWTGPFRR